ncbi:Hypothetical protein VC0266 (sugar utilization related?) [hydrothermal vent metagenome]|uniref:Uracil-DNA glycosylase-like domain-containing protein n=1 Tax=hydrothermal vent metagenome TaxID=652676 RepID=A0A3B0YE10_9ZZZZ
MKKTQRLLITHQSELGQCNLCNDMQGPPVFGEACASKIMLIGQAPGFKEIEVHKPFAWTAGKSLFNWFKRINISEDGFRQHVYMSAICRCFPGKKIIKGVRQKTGDRVPSDTEIKNCSRWLNHEIEILQPQLIIPVGKLAISRFIAFKKLTEVIGKTHTINHAGQRFDMIPLPHPSGASTWPVTEPGKTLLTQALKSIQQHPAWIHNIQRT